MNIEDARQLTRTALKSEITLEDYEKFQEAFSKINAKIEETAKTGNYGVSIFLSELNPSSIKYIGLQLESDGYKIVYMMGNRIEGLNVSW